MTEARIEFELGEQFKRLDAIKLRRSEISSEDTRLRNEDNQLRDEQERLHERVGKLLVGYDRDLVWRIAKAHPKWEEMGARGSVRLPASEGGSSEA